MKRSSIERLGSLYDNEKSLPGDFKCYSQDGVRALLAHFGNPHEKIRSVHIAGTNGKGSTAHMLESIVRRAGYSTGLFTSPHLENIRERIQFNGAPISPRALSMHIEETLDVIRRMGIRPTYFDALTLIAFRYFSNRGVDLAVIETGLGGRLDSTNVITPLASIITDISLDHTNILGGTKAEIAKEKSGIIKEGVPVITSNSERESLAVISRTAVKMRAPLYRLSRDIRVSARGRASAGRIPFSFRFMDARIDAILSPAPGRFQVKNAACAAAAAILLRRAGYVLSDSSIKRGISDAVIPGRFALLSRRPTVIFDPAHNPAAIQSLIGTLKRAYPGKKFIVVLSIMKDKDQASMIGSLQEKLRARILYLVLRDPRCFVPRGDEPEFAGRAGGIPVFTHPSDLLRAIDAFDGKSSPIVFTGSFRLFPEAKKAAARLGKKIS